MLTLARTRPLSSGASPRRSGFTLVELLVALVLFAIVAGILTRTLTSQQRFFTAISEMITVRDRIRRASDMVPFDLRGVSTAGGDLVTMTDSSVDFRSPIGNSVVCSTPTLTTIVLTPVDLKRNNRMTTWPKVPEMGDSLTLYEQDPTPTGLVENWSKHQITAVPTTAICSAATGLTLPGDDTVGVSLQISPAISPSIITGTPARFYRRMQYRLFALSGQWYLGYSDCLPGRTVPCSPVEAIGGPYQPPNGTDPSQNGLQFIPYDSLGAVNNNLAEVARIDIALRGTGGRVIQMPGRPSRIFSDELRTSVAIRNRK